MEQDTSPTFHQRLAVALRDVTESRLLVVCCNTIDERSAVNRQANHASLCSKAISYGGFRENYVFRLKGRLLCTAHVPWRNNEREDFEYYHHDYNSDESAIFYYWDAFDREDDMEYDARVCNLDYNAVVIYPKTLRLVYAGRDAFLRKKRAVTRHHTRRVKGSLITTLAQETAIINAIHEPFLAFCAPAECDCVASAREDTEIDRSQEPAFVDAPVAGPVSRVMQEALASDAVPWIPGLLEPIYPTSSGAL